MSSALGKPTVDTHYGDHRFILKDNSSCGEFTFLFFTDFDGLEAAETGSNGSGVMMLNGRATKCGGLQHVQPVGFGNEKQTGWPTNKATENRVRCGLH